MASRYLSQQYLRPENPLEEWEKFIGTSACYDYEYAFNARGVLKFLQFSWTSYNVLLNAIIVHLH